ncbi:MAG TPA: aldolase/citrate lyase family protein [Ilumatobacter sp.]|nr:aldolase/citrate lyase family protein [Ilumatobacter sp.]
MNDAATPGPTRTPLQPAQWARTLVYLGGHDRDAIARVADAHPDAMCIDLEDSTPLDAKEAGRANLGWVADLLAASGVAMHVRVNAGSQQAVDLAACAEVGVHCLNLPKVESAEMVHEFEERIAATGGRLAAGDRAVWIRPVIETPLGVRNAFEIAAASPLVAYMGGVEGGIYGDLGGALGYEQTADGSETFYLRSRVLLDVRAAQIPFPIGGGTTSRRDVDGQVEFALANRALGYSGMHCMADPDVVRAVNAALTPTTEYLKNLVELVARLEEVERSGAHVAHLDGRVYDLVALERLREQLALGRRLGLVDEAVA